MGRTFLVWNDDIGEKFLENAIYKTVSLVTEIISIMIIYNVVVCAAAVAT